MTDKMTAEQYRVFLQDKENRQETGNRKKYKNVSVVIDGITFDSTKEGHYYSRLKMRKQGGNILKFECHKVFPLIVNGIKITTYEADFVIYHFNGTISVIDVKSSATEHLPVFLIKKALMLALYNIKVEISK